MSVNYDKAQTFMACSSAFAVVNAATDVFTITGNDTTLTSVLKIGISTIHDTASGVYSWYLARRNTANSAGTSAARVYVGMRNNAGATAYSTVLQYTANPTLGVIDANIAAFNLAAPLATIATPDTCGAPAPYVIDFESDFGQPVELYDSDEVLALNLGGAPVANVLTALIWVQWAEQSKT